MYHEHEATLWTANAGGLPRIRLGDVELVAVTAVVLGATLWFHDDTLTGPPPSIAVALGPLLTVAAAAATLVRARLGNARAVRAVTFDATGIALMLAAVLLTPEWFPLVALASSLRAETWRTVLNTCVRTTAVCAAAVSYQGAMSVLTRTTINAEASRVLSLIVAGIALTLVEVLVYRRQLRQADELGESAPGLVTAAVFRDAPAIALGCVACVLLAFSPTALLLLFPLVGLIVRSLRDHERLLAAGRDHKTGLLSFTGFRPQAQAEIGRAARHSRPMALLMMDLDGMKSVNTALGFLAGESVISSMGRVLRETTRAEDLVSRVGGDEFCLLLPDTDTTGAMAVADRIRVAIETTPLTDGKPPVHRTASIGLAMLRSGEDLDTLIERADQGLRIAKREGRNRVILMEPVAAPGPGDTGTTAVC